MKNEIKFISELGGELIINLDRPEKAIFRTGSIIFKAVEKHFNNWLKNEAGIVTQEAYEDSIDCEAHYSKKDAIIEGIWSLLSWAEDNKKVIRPIDCQNIDTSVYE